jgi:predicted phosphate transport protein (TIGR00153 family)
MAIFKTSNTLIRLIDDFFDAIEQGGIIFKIGVDDFLNGDMPKFEDGIKKILELERSADDKRREVEHILYTKSLLPQFRGDVIQLLEKTDDIIDIIKSNLSQFDVEVPFIPKELHTDIRKLTELSVNCIEEVIPAAREYFRSPERVKDHLHKVYFFESEADQLANDIKKRVFQDIPELKLSEKLHLRYFTLHIENVSDTAEVVADLLSVYAIKRTM